MINIKTLLFLFALSFFYQNTSAQFLNWQYEDILTDQRQSGAYPDMVVDENGNFHMSFWDQNVDRLMYGFRDKPTGAWSIFPVDPIHDAGYRSAIALDSMGHVHIAYYENIDEMAYLRYATNAAGSWQNEGVIQNTILGKYGPDLLSESYIELSLDLSFGENGEPVISFFDGSVFATKFCSSALPFNGAIPDVFSLNLNIAQRQGPGNWRITILDYRNRNMPGCIRDASDRFGEFCKIMLRGDSLLLVTNALYSHELLLLKADKSATDSWLFQAIDSVSRVVNEVVMYEEGFHFSDAKLIGDSVLHLAYGVSEAYGRDFTITVPVSGRPGIHRNFFYTQIFLDSLGHPDYSPFHHEFTPLPRDGNHRSYFALDVVQNDTLYLAYYDTQTGDVVMTYSEDKGRTWLSDTLWQKVNTNARLLCKSFGDSIFVGHYASDKDQILMASRHRAGGPWQYESATKSQERGRYLSAAVDRPATGSDRLHIVFDEKNQDQLFYGTQSTGTWQFEPIGPSGEKAQMPSLALDANKQPIIAYSSGKSGALSLARFDGAIWVNEVVDTTKLAESPQLVITGDTLHIGFLDRGNGTLNHAWSQAGSGTWRIQVVDSSTNSLFRIPSMQADTLGRLHMAYALQGEQRIRYARRTAGMWKTSFASDTMSFSPAHLDLKIRKKTALPTIIFKDGLVDEIFVAEQSSLGFWGIRSVIQTQGQFVGNPLSLVLAEGDIRWLLYNYETNNPAIRLLRRHPWNREWIPVSVVNNLGEIAETFEFLLAEDDFYIIGKKNAFQNKGIGMLYAEDGATTDLALVIYPKKSLNLYPNPSNGSCQLSFELLAGSAVQISIWNIHAQKQAFAFPQKTMPPGNHSIEVNTSELPSGIYLCKVQIGSEVQIRKLAIQH